MTPRERVLCDLAGDMPDVFPFRFSFTPDLQRRFEERTGSSSPTKHFSFDMRHVGFRGTERQADLSSYLEDKGVMKLARVTDAARSANPGIHVYYHSDGDVRAIVPELMEAGVGVDVLNPVQPECMDPAELRKIYPGLSFRGTIGTQTTPFGTPDEVKRTVHRRIRECGSSLRRRTCSSRTCRWRTRSLSWRR